MLTNSRMKRESTTYNALGQSIVAFTDWLHSKNEALSVAFSGELSNICAVRLALSMVALVAAVVIENSAVSSGWAFSFYMISLFTFAPAMVELSKKMK